MSQSSQYKAMESYFNALLTEPKNAPEPLPEVLPVPAVAFAEPEREQKLAGLLSSVESAQKVAVKSEMVTTSVVAPVVQAAPPATPVWQNIETEKEFQALFFVVSGVTFAVPLTELGGIHQLTKINTLFGKPEWFSGVMMQRDAQLNVVDTTRWIMPGKVAESPYEYLVMLGSSVWGLACHQLIGTELLQRDRIQWRNSAGRRPWLAGMVKDKMCALLHVRELLTLLERGVNIDGI
jgi:Chemotaxis protein histidine kinase and related kinases